MPTQQMHFNIMLYSIDNTYSNSSRMSLMIVYNRNVTREYFFRFMKSNLIPINMHMIVYLTLYIEYTCGKKKI